MILLLASKLSDYNQGKELKYLQSSFLQLSLWYQIFFFFYGSHYVTISLFYRIHFSLYRHLLHYQK